jgi:hypothetical protein
MTELELIRIEERLNIYETLDSNSFVYEGERVVASVDADRYYDFDLKEEVEWIRSMLPALEKHEFRQVDFWNSYCLGLGKKRDLYNKAEREISTILRDSAHRATRLLRLLRQSEQMLLGVLMKKRIERQRTEANKGADKKRATGPNPLAIKYIEACEKSKNSEPSLRDLTDNTDVSRSMWQRALASKLPTFLIDLGKEIKKKIKAAKTETKKSFWVKVFVHIGDLQEEAAEKLQHPSRKKQLHENTRPEPSDRKKGGRAYYEPSAETEED